jgi:hypothetical protein
MNGLGVEKNIIENTQKSVILILNQVSSEKEFISL